MKKKMFTRIFHNARFEQVVMMRRQDNEGAPEIRFYFKPAGHGVAEFGIGFLDDDNCDADTKLDVTFNTMTSHDAVALIDGWMGQVMAKAN